MTKKLSLILVLICATASFAQKTEWREYAYTEDGFAVSAPVQAVAKRDSSKAKDGSELHNYYFTITPESGFMASVTNLHRPGMTASAVLQKTKESTIRNVNGKLIAQRPVMLGKAQGVQFEFTCKDYHARVRYFFLNGKLFGVMSIVPPGQPLLPDTNHFLTSLHLLQ